jgi:hypothetical protein
MAAGRLQKAQILFDFSALFLLESPSACFPTLNRSLGAALMESKKDDDGWPAIAAL